MSPVCRVRRMLHLSNIFVVLLLSFFPLHSKGQTLKIESSPSGITYVKKGETLTLNVTFAYTGNEMVGVAWWFGGKRIIEKDVAGKTNQFNKRASIKGSASLVLNNTMVTDNGTYSIQLKVGDVQDVAEGTFTVMIIVQPDAKISCTSNAYNFTCLCSGTGGNPPASTLWSKDNITIRQSSSSSILLDKEDFIQYKEGTYTCRATSENLSDEHFVQLSKPKIETFTSDSTNNVAVVGKEIKITCKATANPSPEYLIFLNDTGLKDVVNGVKTLTVNSRNMGRYTCVAKNIFGNITQSFTLQVKDGSDDGVSESSGLSVGAVAGIVIGVLFLIVIVIGLVWWFFFKNGGGKERGGDSPAVRPTRSRDDNQYDTAEKGEPSRSGNSVPAAAAAPLPGSDVPPVYAAVDKTKKTKKPPPSSSPTSVQYASLDPVALQPDSSRMRVRETNDTQYAAIDLEKLQSDLV